jgi:UDP-glucose 4-epimerase
VDRGFLAGHAALSNHTSMSALSKLSRKWAQATRGPIVVTGSNGYLGRNMAQTLVQAGVHVFGVQRNADRDAAFQVIEGDLASPGVLDPLLSDGTVVFHLASTSSVARSVEDPRREIKDNFQALFEVLESTRRFHSRLVYASSICVADPESALPHSERVGLSPRSPYGACKAAGELLVSTYFHCYGLPATIARISTVYGPGLRRFALYDFYRKLLSDSERLEILGDGNQMRDYIYLDDALAGLLLIASRGQFGETYNLGSGKPIASRELAQAVAEAMRLPSPEIVALGESFPGDIARWAMDITKIKRLGFEPKIDLATGLASVVESHRTTETYEACRV